MQTEGVSVVVCALNAADRVRAFTSRLHAELMRLPFPAELLFVDDGSTDGTAEAARALGHDVKVVEHHVNRGLSAARNTATINAAHPWLLFCDDDLEIDAATIEALYARRSDFDVIVPEVRGLDGQLQNSMTACWRRLDWKFDYHHEPLERVEFAVGACFLVHTNTVRRAGGFDERFRLYFEDTVFGVAVKRAGGQTLMQRGAVALHHLHGGDAGVERARRNARQVFKERWRFNLVVLTGQRRAVNIVVGLPRTLAQGLRYRSLEPLVGYLAALRDVPTLLRDRALYDLRSR